MERNKIITNTKRSQSKWKRKYSRRLRTKHRALDLCKESVRSGVTKSIKIRTRRLATHVEGNEERIAQNIDKNGSINRVK